jgi:phosphoglycerol geranylgeranyltransferase
MVGSVEKRLLEKIEAEGSIHITLIDPEKVTPPQASQIASKARTSGTTAIMIGGSTFVSSKHLDDGISRYAHAIWFMSLLNSADPYFIMGAQVLGAPLVKRYGLEPIPMGYIIVGEGGTAGIVGKAIAVPYNKPELVVAHALAGQYLGMRFIYLEAGSGAKEPVPPDMIRAVKQYLDVPLIVGGGIRSRGQALAAASAGADIIVTGNVVENNGVRRKVSEIIEGLRHRRI